MVAAWVYSPSGRTDDADVAITGSAPVVEADTKITLHSADAFRERQHALKLVGAIMVPDDELLNPPENREDEVSLEIRDRVRDGREALKTERG
jgi:hypothetical protein